MQEQGRLDQLAVNILAHLIRTRAPNVAPVWDNGLGSLATHYAPRLLPSHPVDSVRIGQLNIPLDLLAAFARAAKLLPEGPRVGA